jgi:hypothetical protein
MTSEAGMIEGVFDQFDGQGYSSFAEAEVAAGYHIPQPGAQYQAIEGTFLRTGGGQPRPASSSNYLLPGAQRQQTIVVDVAPAYYWPEGALTLGDRTRVGEHEGWVRAFGTGWIFKFACGNVDNVDLWCVIRSAQGVPRPAFEEFVSSIR